MLHSVGERNARLAGRRRERGPTHLSCKLHPLAMVGERVRARAVIFALDQRRDRGWSSVPVGGRARGRWSRYIPTNRFHLRFHLAASPPSIPLGTTPAIDSTLRLGDGGG